MNKQEAASFAVANSALAFERDDARERADRLERQLKNTQDAMDRLATEVNLLRANQEASKREADRKMENFRQRVVDVAMQYARENEWCSEVHNALNDLGLGDKDVEQEIELKLCFTLVTPGSELDFSAYTEFGMSEEAIFEKAKELSFHHFHSVEVSVND